MNSEIIVRLNQEEYKLYTEFQKEFGIASDIYHSGLKRAYRKNVGRIRKNTSNALFKASRIEEQKWKKALRDSNLTKEIVNPEADKKLLKNAKRLKARVIKGNAAKGLLTDSGGYQVDLKQSGNAIGTHKKMTDAIFEARWGEGGYKGITWGKRKKISKTLKKTKKGMENSRYEHMVVSNNNPATLAHELGHAESNMNLKTAKNYYSGKNSIKGEYWKDLNQEKRSWKDILGGHKSAKTVIGEEKEATKRGLKMMKKAGYTKEELEAAKRNLKASGDTYRRSTNVSLLNRVAAKVQIPSRQAKEEFLYQDLMRKNTKGKKVPTFKEAKEWASENSFISSKG